MRNPGVDQNFTDLVAAVQLRLRVAIGLQALQRCSGLLNRRARGSTVATHHFGIRGETTYHPPLRTESLQVGVLPDAPIYGHVVKPEQQRVQTQNLAALGVQFPSCPPSHGDWLQRE